MTGQRGFFPQLEKKPNMEVDQFDFECSDGLREIVVNKRKRREKWSRSRWADEFRKLRQELDDDRNRILAALKWYNDNVNLPFTPIIDSAKSFRSKFNKLEDRMHKEGATVVISESAKTIADKLKKTLRWPKSSESQLELCIQISLDNLENYKKELNQITGKNLKGFVESLSKGCLFNFPTLFVSAWFQRIHAKVQGWDSWSGDLKSMVFSKDSKEWYSLLCERSTLYSGSDKYAKQLKEELA